MSSLFFDVSAKIPRSTKQFPIDMHFVVKFEDRGTPTRRAREDITLVTGILEF